MKDQDEIRIGGPVTLYQAPVGTAAPTDSTTALNAAFVDLGYTTEDGTEFAREKTIQVVKANQSLFPLRRVVTDLDAMLNFTMIQWNKTNLELALDGTVTEPDPTGAPGEYKFTPDASETVNYGAYVAEWSDEDTAGTTLNYRIYIPKGVSLESVNTQLRRYPESRLPIQVGVVHEDGSDPYAIFTNDPAFDPS